MEEIMKKIFTKNIVAVICILALMLTALFAGCGETANEVVQEDTQQISSKTAGGYITKEYTEIDTGNVLLKIDEGVYVPVYTVEYIETIYKAIEEVSGLTFDGGSNNQIKVNIHVEKNVDNSSESEAYHAYAFGAEREVVVSPGDLLLGNSYAIVHELSHILNASYSDKWMSQVISEGFAEYVCYRAIQYLEKNSPEVAYSIEPSVDCVYNMSMMEPDAVYSQPLEYWMENGFPTEYAGNGSYTVGFRFMTYLDDVYGSCSKWVALSDIDVDYADPQGFTDQISIDDQVKILKEAYDKDVLDNFYPWLKENSQQFSLAAAEAERADLSGAKEIALYPFFMSFDCKTELYSNGMKFKYKDLCINVEEAKNYLSEYKERDISNLKLNVMWPSGANEIELLDKNMKSIKTVKEDTQIDLDGVSYIVLKGEGVCAGVEIVGYTDYEGNIK